MLAGGGDAVLKALYERSMVCTLAYPRHSTVRPSAHVVVRGNPREREAHKNSSRLAPWFDLPMILHRYTPDIPSVRRVRQILLFRSRAPQATCFEALVVPYRLLTLEPSCTA